MKISLPRFLLLALVLTLVSAVTSGGDRSRDIPTRASAETIISSWASTPQQVARQMIQKYGEPQEATASMLVWHNNGPWKRTIVSSEEIPHEFPKPHTDVLEQFVDYRVPPANFDDLAEYDGSVIAERTRGEISARCDKEEMNFLALNLANDIVEGKRSVAEARKFYTESVKAFMEKKPVPYTQRLQFQVTRGGTADLDRPTM